MHWSFVGYLLLALGASPGAQIAKETPGTLLQDSVGFQWVGGWPYGPSHAVAVDSLRNLVFMASGGGIWILEGSDPANLVRVGEFRQFPEPVQYLYYDANTFRLYGFGGGTFAIIDVSDPTHPKQLSEVTLSNPPSDILQSQNYVYFLSRNHGLEVMDVSDPYDPEFVGYCWLPHATRMALYQNYLYCENPEEILVVDVTDPWNPTVVNVCPSEERLAALEVSGSYLFLGGDSVRLWILDLSDPLHPVQVASYEVPGGVRDLWHNGFLLYLLHSNSWSLWILDISDPLNPILASIWELSSFSRYSFTALAPVGHWVYLAEGRNGLKILSVSDPSDPQLIGEYPTFLSTIDVEVIGNYAFLRFSREQRKICILDISDPTYPVCVHVYETPGPVDDIAARDPYLYVAMGDAGLRILDFSDPTNPEEVGVYDPFPSVLKVLLSGPYAFVIDNLPALRILDISDPSNPTQISLTPLFTSVEDFLISGPYVYVLFLFPSVLQILDVSAPENPVMITSLNLPNCTWNGNLNEGVLDSLLALSCDFSHLLLYDISNPAEPDLVFSDTVPFSLRGVFPMDPYFLAYGDDLTILDVSSPDQPFPVTAYPVPGSVCRVTLRGAHMYLASSSCGLQIVSPHGFGVEEVEGDRVQPLLRVIPLARQEIRFWLGAPSPVRVWDVAGRLRWETRRTSVGWHRVPVASWPSGVYLLRAHHEYARVIVLNK